MSEVAKNPYRILIRVPVGADGLPAGQLRGNLALLLSGLRGSGFSSFLVAPARSPREDQWDLVEGWDDEFFRTRIELWGGSSPSALRELEEILAAELDSSNAAAITPLAVLIPFSPGAPPRTSAGKGFAAVVDLNGEKPEASPERFYFAYPREAVALLNHVGAGISGRLSVAKGGDDPPDDPRRGPVDGRHLPMSLDRDLGSIRGEKPPVYRDQRPPLTRSAESEAESEVYLGVGVPEQVAPGEYFVARLAAYTAAFRNEVRRVLRSEAPSARQRLDLDRSRWKIGTRVAVRLSATGAKVEPEVRHFSWDGEREILRFDVTVEPGFAARQLVLRFDLFVEGLQIASLRPEVALTVAPGAGGARELEVTAPKSAFASYSSKDEKEVLARIRSVQISTGMDVFVDRMSLVPGQQWHQELEKEIARRDVFWLFWSRHAMESEYVAWEWQTALHKKTLAGILPHPLEPANLAPPPPELSALQFGGAYEAYLASLGKPG